MKEYRLIYQWDYHHWTLLYKTNNVKDIHQYIKQREEEMYDVYDESIPRYFEFLYDVDGETKVWRQGAPDELLESIEYLLRKQGN